MQAPDEPTILDAVVGPGHDGEAVLVVRIRYPGGAVDSVTLAANAARRLLENCGVDEADKLAGQHWRHLLNVMQSEAPRRGR